MTNLSKSVPNDKNISLDQGEVKPKLTPLNVHGFNRIKGRTYQHVSTVAGPFYLFRWKKTKQTFAYSRLELLKCGITTDKLPTRFPSDKHIIEEHPIKRKPKNQSDKSKPIPSRWFQKILFWND